MPAKGGVSPKRNGSTTVARPAGGPRRLHPRNLRTARRELARIDPALGQVIAEHGAARIRPSAAPDPFRSLARSIIYQQLSGKAAGSIHSRFLAIFGDAEPTPDRLRSVSEQRLRQAGLSAAKTRSLHDLAERYLAGSLPTSADLGAMRDEQIIEHFVCVRGIGRWTVEMMLIFELGRPDVLPLNDLGIRRGWMYLRGAEALPDPRRLETDGEQWRPWRSVASWYLWRANELEEV